MLQALLFAIGALVGVQAPSSDAALLVTPSRVDVGLGYRGVTLSFRARVSEGGEAAIRLVGPVVPLDLKEKGRVAGVLWMSVADVRIEGVPAFYYLLTTGPLREMGSPEELAAWRLGYDAALGSGAPAGWQRTELVKLKQRDGLYKVVEGGLVRVPQPGGGDGWAEGTLDLPARLQPGTWTIELIEIRDGRPVAAGETSLTVEHAGGVRLIRDIALEHGGWYGAAAVVIAIVAGLLTGVLFRSKPRAGH